MRSPVENKPQGNKIKNMKEQINIDPPENEFQNWNPPEDNHLSNSELEHLHREPNDIWVRDNPVIDSLKRRLLNHKYCRERTLSENPEALRAAFSILETLIQGSDTIRKAGSEDLPRITVARFLPFTVSESEAAGDLGVSEECIQVARKSLSELGLIWTKDYYFPLFNLGFKTPAQFRLAKKSGAVEASGSITKLNLKCQTTAA